MYFAVKFFVPDLPLPLSGGHVNGCVQQVTVRGVPLDVLCDMLPVFEPVEQLMCLDIKDPQEVGLTFVSWALCVELPMAPLHCRASALTS